MDLLTMLDHELSSMHLNDFEKVRYIYLRTCELFSFDARYNYTSLFSDDLLYDAIINRKIDIRNVNDFLVVCHSYSREVLMKLIRELTTAQVEVYGEAHSYVKYQANWLLDATYGDLARVKLGLETRGFEKIPQDKQLLAETDSIIGYTPKSKMEYLEKIDLSSIDTIFKSINLLLRNSKCNKEFSDALFFVEWILYGINCYEFKESCYVGEDYKFHQIFIFPNIEHIFCLSKEDESYGIKCIGREECMKLVRNLKTKDNIVK